jgi:hypothetical protein
VLNAFGYALLEFPDISGTCLGWVSLSGGDAALKPASSEPDLILMPTN